MAHFVGTSGQVILTQLNPDEVVVSRDRLTALEAMEQRAICFRDFPAQVPYPHPDWSRATTEAAVARAILEGD